MSGHKIHPHRIYFKSSTLSHESSVCRSFLPRAGFEPDRWPDYARRFQSPSRRGSACFRDIGRISPLLEGDDNWPITATSVGLKETRTSNGHITRDAPATRGHHRGLQ